jgi:hypothetical protein
VAHKFIDSLPVFIAGYVPGIIVSSPFHFQVEVLSLLMRKLLLQSVHEPGRHKLVPSALHEEDGDVNAVNFAD